MESNIKTMMAVKIDAKGISNARGVLLNIADHKELMKKKFEFSCDGVGQEGDRFKNIVQKSFGHLFDWEGEDDSKDFQEKRD